ncbi:acyltransferase [Shimia thalassica]|uniref:Acyltransferase family protein n=1 Tax=Shimia thalassica TaxID=1715693 RepID=A0A0P1IQZ2_9RHOB|nr:acyltransferase [Shimia thalassica]MBU2944305.1 acyltransferase [Shimia thalassica]MDO6483085.1 acyltransferase [Shimia thalassica]MDO6504991.1 acyltransferase [Shimia thalassica]MDO6523279.1 acyltransferase [Shimia thalassica]CUJ98103.1 Acyltransferase family protein [Shimia thalassica]
MSNNRFLREYGDTDFITGLRALAATMVVIIHTGAFLGWGAAGSAITHAGKYGVDIFFVISGFTIAKTFTEASSYRTYLTRRIMRILPLYYVLITFAILVVATNLISPSYWMLQFGAKPDFYNWIMHLSMLSYLDYRVANSVLGVEWSIPIEVFWYVALPSMLFLSKSLKGAVAAMFALAFLTATFSYASKKFLGTSLPIKWTPISQGHLFFLGAWAFFFRSRNAGEQQKHAKIWIMVATSAMLVPMIVEFGGRGEVFALSTAIFIAFLQPDQFRVLCRILTVRPMLFLGSISFSIYLIHPLVIQVLEDFGMINETGGFAKFSLVYGITVAFSSCTYILIEKPTNKFGRKMVEREKLNV